MTDTLEPAVPSLRIERDSPTRVKDETEHELEQTTAPSTETELPSFNWPHVDRRLPKLVDFRTDNELPKKLLS